MAIWLWRWPSLAVGLVFYCYITNYRIISCFKKHPCIILWSNRGLPEFSAQGFTRLQSRCVFSSEAQWGQCQKWGEGGKIHLAPSGSRNNSFAYGCSTKGHIFLLLLVKSVLNSSSLPIATCCMPLSDHGSRFHRSQCRESLPAKTES